MIRCFIRPFLWIPSLAQFSIPIGHSLPQPINELRTDIMELNSKPNGSISENNLKLGKSFYQKFGLYLKAWFRTGGFIYFPNFDKRILTNIFI